eukprot:scaffold196077_cov18-Tisochrysis_lutea.AAC.2
MAGYTLAPALHAHHAVLWRSQKPLTRGGYQQQLFSSIMPIIMAAFCVDTSACHGGEGCPGRGTIGAPIVAKW